jgi:hypothetical protein
LAGSADNAELINYIVLIYLPSKGKKNRNSGPLFLLMASKSVDSIVDLPAKRKRTTNPKLLDDDNISADAIKRRKLESSKSSSLTTPGTSKNSNLDTISAAQSSKTSSESSRQASVECVEDEDDTSRHNAGPPKNSRYILESTEDEDEDDTPPAKKTQMPKPKKTKPVERETTEGDEKSKDESDEEELGKSGPLTHTKLN